MASYTSLKDLLQHTATVCHKEGKINQVHPHKQDRYFKSGMSFSCDAGFDSECGFDRYFMSVCHFVEILVLTVNVVLIYTNTLINPNILN